MRNYQWWSKQKKRVKKKYKLLSGAYLSPKEQKNISRMICFWCSIATDILRECVDKMTVFEDPNRAESEE